MKNFLLSILFFLFYNAIIGHAQSTWVRTLNLDTYSASIHEDSTTVGPLELILTPNGTIISLLQANRDHQTWLIAIDSTGKVIWQKWLASHAGTYRDDCYSLHPTNDNGCIYIKRRYDNAAYWQDSVFRVSSSGQIVWAKNYLFPAPTPDNVYNVSQTNYNTTLVQFTDSILELDASGNIIQNRVPFSRTSKLIHLPDSDFIYCDSSIITKENFQGSIRWSLTTLGFELASANTDFIYTRNASQVMKITTLTGGIQWTKPILSDALSQTSDFGFITIRGNVFAKYDSSGIQQWNKTILLPHFGLKCLAEIPGNAYVTGGCWRNFDLVFTSDTGYSPLLFTLDSIGNSVIDSVNYFINGNANDNNKLTFGDDAVFVAAAMNNAGPSRDTLLRNLRPGLSVFAADWQGRFASGINYKFSDVDGNGVINTNDLSELNQLPHPYTNHITPHWLKTSNQVLPDLKFVFENHVWNFGDTVVIDVILGSPAVPTDSIYGLSCEFYLNYIHPGSSVQSFYSIKPNAFGDISQNLFVFYRLDQQAYPKLSSFVLSRTDHTNTVVSGDTIIRLYYIFPQNTTFINPVTISAHWNAINEAGYPISLNTVTDSIYFSGLSGVNSISENKLKLFPNPVIDKMNIVFDDNEEYRIRIYDNLGRLIYESKPEKSYINLDLKNFNDGVYYISAKSENKNLKSRFVIQH